MAGTGQTPCPYRIIDDCGSAFGMGALGGGLFHLIKGMRNSPRGARLRGGFNAVTLRGPTLGGNFAVWGGLFATFDCTFQYIRRQDDPWNAIMSGATTGGILAARAGWKPAGRSALIGGMLLGLIEGLGILANKAFAPPEEQPAVLAPLSADLESSKNKGFMEETKSIDEENTDIGNFSIEDLYSNGGDDVMYIEEDNYDADKYELVE